MEWVVSAELAELLEGHPKLRKVWGFDRKSGLKTWVQLCHRLWLSQFDQVVDLHRSLRTRIARWLFWYWSIGKPENRPRWRVLEKRRLQSWGYFCFKRFWPRAWRPLPQVQAFVKLAGGKGSERPDLRHLVSHSQPQPWENSPFVCVMPSSRWPGKEWPAERYLELLKKTPSLPVILGSPTDRNSLELARLLKSAEVMHINGIGVWDLRTVASVLSRARAYLGSDTGLAHLAEAVGAPAWVVYGPTVPDMGFGPWRSESKALEYSLWCRPCGKDGRYCYRPFKRYKCLADLKPERVLELINVS